VWVMGALYKGRLQQSERLRTGRARGEPEEPEAHGMALGRGGVMVWHLVGAV
jgi:hypothetical protein